MRNKRRVCCDSALSPMAFHGFDDEEGDVAWHLEGWSSHIPQKSTRSSHSQSFSNSAASQPLHQSQNRKHGHTHRKHVHNHQSKRMDDDQHHHQHHHKHSRDGRQARHVPPDKRQTGCRHTERHPASVASAKPRTRHKAPRRRAASADPELPPRRARRRDAPAARVRGGRKPARTSSSDWFTIQGGSSSSSNSTSRGGSHTLLGTSPHKDQIGLSNKTAKPLSVPKKRGTTHHPPISHVETITSNQRVRKPRQIRMPQQKTRRPSVVYNRIEPATVRKKQQTREGARSIPLRKAHSEPPKLGTVHSHSPSQTKARPTVSSLRMDRSDKTTEDTLFPTLSTASTGGESATFRHTRSRITVPTHTVSAPRVLMDDRAMSTLTDDSVTHIVFSGGRFRRA